MSLASILDGIGVRAAQLFRSTSKIHYWIGALTFTAIFGFLALGPSLFDEQPEFLYSDLDSISHDLLVVNVWLGANIPVYLPQVLSNISKNPSLSLFLVASWDAVELCGKESRPELPLHKYTNIHIHCMTKEEIYNNLVGGMCRAWQCKKQERVDVTKSLSKLLETPYRMNDLKPVYMAAFYKLARKSFPERRFSHWLRLDLDVFVGDIAKHMPWVDLEHDVVSFTPRLNQDARETVFRGYFTIMKLTQKMNNIFLRMPNFESPSAFIAASGTDTFVSVDEGHFSKAILQASDVSFKLVPGQVFLDNDADWAAMTIMLQGQTPEIVFAKPTAPGQALEEKPVRELISIQYLGPDAFTDECSMYFWIPKKDHWCIKNDNPIMANTENSGIAIRRAPGDPRVALETILAPFHVSKEVTTRPALAVHLMESKLHEAETIFGPRGWVLSSTELMELYYDRDAKHYRSKFQRPTLNGTPVDFLPRLYSNHTSS
ncbi:hypothetical protein MRB53_039129 [Persea americana]|nr:hypothetical protein MRB53_039129 [Persea americana]